jgi:hypothetical protein
MLWLDPFVDSVPCWIPFIRAELRSVDDVHSMGSCCITFNLANLPCDSGGMLCLLTVFFCDALCSDVISKDDVKVFAAVPSKPGAESPNAARWYETVSAALAARCDFTLQSMLCSSYLGVNRELERFQFVWRCLICYTGCRFPGKAAGVAGSSSAAQAAKV